jgi:hypothetical protein
MTRKDIAISAMRSASSVTPLRRIGMAMVKLIIKQAGEIVASVDCEDRARAEQEAAHYAFMYSADGPVEIHEIKPRKRLSPQETER